MSLSFDSDRQPLAQVRPITASAWRHLLRIRSPLREGDLILKSIQAKVYRRVANTHVAELEKRFRSAMDLVKEPMEATVFILWHEAEWINSLIGSPRLITPAATGKASAMSEEKFLRLKEVQERFSVSRATVWRWRKLGLRVVAIGNVVRVSHEDLAEFVEQHLKVTPAGVDSHQSAPARPIDA
jgi:predicted DNA-binding transcriptional regulator AlpA